MSDATSVLASAMPPASSPSDTPSLNWSDHDYTADDLSKPTPARQADAAAQASPQAAAQPANQPVGEPASAPAGEPADYDLSLPDGMEANTPLLEEFKTLAGEFKLNRAQARKLLDLEVKNAQSTMERWQHQQKTWEKEIKSDREFGGDNMSGTVSAAKRALDHYDKGNSLYQELTRGGYGNHPAIIRFLACVGRDISEDTAHSGNAAKADQRPLCERLWPDSTMP